MRIWGKKAEGSKGSASVAAVALAGSSHEGLVREALGALTQSPCPDRVGVWREPEPNAHSPSELSGAFHGLVWDRTAREECPPEWKILSLEPPLPEQLLLRTEPFEQNLDDSVRNAVIGQVVGLRRALWVPVADQSRARGLVLLGSVSSSPALFLDRAKAVAAELALALQAEEQLRAVRIRVAELDLARQIVQGGSDRSSLDRLLNYMVGDCVRGSGKEEGLGATFAAIGTTPFPSGRFFRRRKQIFGGEAAMKRGLAR